MVGALVVVGAMLVVGADVVAAYMTKPVKRHASHPNRSHVIVPVKIPRAHGKSAHLLLW